MRKLIHTIVLTLLLLAAAAITAAPLVWMVARSFHRDTVLPDQSTLTAEHYTRLLQDYPSRRWMANSLFIAGWQTLVGAAAASLAGYVLAWHQFRGRRLLLVLLVATLLLPAQVALPASWNVIRHLHLLDSYLALIIPAASTALGALLFRQASLQIPHELLDAARIDGCSEWRIWWDVVLPVVQPTMVTFAVLSFTANWNAYLWPQILLQDEGKYTLAMGLATLSAMPGNRVALELMLAATALSILPAFALFLAARGSLQETITEGTGK